MLCHPAPEMFGRQQRDGRSPNHFCCEGQCCTGASPAAPRTLGTAQRQVLALQHPPLISKLGLFSGIRDFSELSLSWGEVRTPQDGKDFKGQICFALQCFRILLMSTAESYVFIYHH